MCEKGYDPKEWRSPTDGSNRPMDMDAHCAEAASKTNARGAQNAPRAGAAYRAPVAAYDLDAASLTWGDQPARVAYDGGAAALYGDDSWKSLLMNPLL